MRFSLLSLTFYTLIDLITVFSNHVWQIDSVNKSYKTRNSGNKRDEQKSTKFDLLIKGGSRKRRNENLV